MDLNRYLKKQKSIDPIDFVENELNEKFVMKKGTFPQSGGGLKR